jgi:hypothetical protein
MDRGLATFRNFLTTGHKATHWLSPFSPLKRHLIGDHARDGAVWEGVVEDGALDGSGFQVMDGFPSGHFC